MRITGPPCPALIEQPNAQSPFASWGCYPVEGDVSHHLGRRYPSQGLRRISVYYTLVRVALPQRPFAGRKALVSGAVARPTASTKPCMKLSLHTAPQYTSLVMGTPL
jgi:hypothetical protein